MKSTQNLVMKLNEKEGTKSSPTKSTLPHGEFPKGFNPNITSHHNFATTEEELIFHFSQDISR